MMVTTSIAIILLVIIDIYLLKQIDKHEIAIIELLKKNVMITRRDTDEN